MCHDTVIQLIQTDIDDRVNGYVFDLERMTSFEGDTGPYLQYAHARLYVVPEV
jgi:arginyl-tRNA synthetase